MLDRFDMKDAKSVSAPFAANFRFSAGLCPHTYEEIKYMSHVPYSCSIGNVMYVVVCIRPDILHSVSMVS